jgi:hypothetical protein
MARGKNKFALDSAKGAFLAAFINYAHIGRAAAMAGVDRRTVRQWRVKDPEFLAAYEEAGRIATETLEDEAYRRACKGVTRPVLYQGEQVMVPDKDNPGKKKPLVEHVYSDVLMIFLLKARDPEKYRERQQVDFGKGALPVKQFENVDTSKV